MLNEIINKSSQRLIDSVITLFTSPYNRYSYCYSMIDENLYLDLFLNQIGFSTSGSGFYHNGLGHDGYTYYWSSSMDKRNDHKWIRFKDFTDGIPYPDGMYYNDKYYLRLKCIKKQ